MRQPTGFLEVLRGFLIAAILAIVMALPAAAFGADAKGPAIEEVATYQKEFGVSSEVAEERLELQHRGGTIVAQLEKAEGDAYAGVWFDNQAGEFVVPLADADARGNVEAAVATLGLASAHRIVAASYTWHQLEETQREVNAEVRPLAAKLLVQTFLDPRTNRVVVDQAQTVSDAQWDKVEGVENDGAVEVREAGVDRFESEASECSNELRACRPPLRGGVQILPKNNEGYFYCTAGFKAIDRATGARYLLTAGHCVAPHAAEPWFARYGDTEKWVQIGNPGPYTYPVRDWGEINATGSFWDTAEWPTEVVLWGAEEERSINYEGASYIGEAVCHSGVKSGYSCGTVSKMNLTVTYKSGATIENMTEVEGPNYCSLGGDSGGPVIAGNTAVGIQSGGPAEATTCPDGYGLYQEITEATDAMNVTVAPRSPAWHGLQKIGGTLTSNLSVASWGTGRLDVFARGLEGALWHRFWSYATGWGAWESMGGSIQGDPSAVSWGSGRIDVVARMSDNSVGHWYWGGAGWGYDNLGGYITSSPKMVSWGPNRLDIFARGSTNEMAHMAYDSVWYPWENLPGGTFQGDPAAVSWGSGRLDVVARMADNSVGHWYWAPGWGYDNLGGYVTSSPAITSWGPNRLDVFARGSTNEIAHKAWAGAWYPWENPGGGTMVGDPSATSPIPGRLDVVARMSSNTLGHWYWAGSTWAYDNQGGPLISSPAISAWPSPFRLDVFGTTTGSEGAHWWWG